MRLDEITRRGLLKGAGAIALSPTAAARSVQPGMVAGTFGQLYFQSKDNGNITMSNGARGNVRRFSENDYGVTMDDGEKGSIYMSSRQYGRIMERGLRGDVSMKTKDQGTVSIR